MTLNDLLMGYFLGAGVLSITGLALVTRTAFQERKALGRFTTTAQVFAFPLVYFGLLIFSTLVATVFLRFFK